jgi:uncharacterized protein YcbK (DUF882 family)
MAARAIARRDRGATEASKISPGKALPAVAHRMSRREVLGMIGAAAGVAALTPHDVLAEVQVSANQMRVQPVPRPVARRVWLHNVNTGETFDDVYWQNGRYIGSSLSQLNILLRDHHSGAATQIDPRLFDILAQLQNNLRLREPFQVVSAYRTPQTNSELYMHSSGVAENSLHMRGMAIDVMTQSRSSAEMTRAARAMHVGGVGDYIGARFIHVDSGPFRTWTY